MPYKHGRGGATIDRGAGVRCAYGAQRDIGAIETEARCKLEEWRTLLTRQTQDGRELLRQILVGPIRFMPDGKMYRFHGKAALARLLAGAASNLCGVPGRS